MRRCEKKEVVIIIYKLVRFQKLAWFNDVDTQVWCARVLDVDTP